jgi:predicted ATPase
VLRGLWNFYLVRAEHQTAQELAEQLLTLAQRPQTPALLLEAFVVLEISSFWQGALAVARTHLEQASALYDPQQHHAHAFLYGLDPGIASRCYAAQVLWALGYPEQARQRLEEGLSLAQELQHRFSLAAALVYAAQHHQLRQEGPIAQARAEAASTLSTEQGFPHWLAAGTVFKGWALTAQGQAEEGIAQLQQGLAAWRATGAKLGLSWVLPLLAEAYGKAGQVEVALQTLAEALAMVEQTQERFYEAELYRLQGALLLAHTAEPSTEVATCFHRAVAIARRQQAKSLELRAATSLARLWQQQGKRTEAYELLAPLYGWFTEGFDMADLQEAKALLAELAG